VPFLTRIAVVSDTGARFRGARLSDVVENPDPSLGQARSLCHGCRGAKEAGAEAVLVALADMPRVTAAHIYRMFDRRRRPGTIVASSDGVHPMPPALFGKDLFPNCSSWKGDEGARALIRRGHHVVPQPGRTGRCRHPRAIWGVAQLYGLRDRRRIALIRAGARRSD
jgi:molybdenum cofactor cytidylyltransferase